MESESSLIKKAKKFPIINGRDDFDKFFEFEDVKISIRKLRKEITSRGSLQLSPQLIIGIINEIFGEELK